MIKQCIGAQGEVTIYRVDAIPNGLNVKPATDRDSAGRVILSHSEKGHHHVLTGGDVLEQTSGVPAGMRYFWATLASDEQLVQNAPHPHEHHDLPSGFYQFRTKRQFNPFAEEAQAVRD